MSGFVFLPRLFFAHCLLLFIWKDTRSLSPLTQLALTLLDTPPPNHNRRDETTKIGPWSYRLCSLFIMTPLYPIILVGVGTVFGRHAYFRHFAVRMFSRFGIPPELRDKNFTENARHFKKW